MSDGVKVEEWQDNGRTETLKRVAVHPALLLTRACDPLSWEWPRDRQHPSPSLGDGVVHSQMNRSIGGSSREKTWYIARADDKGQRRGGQGDERRHAVPQRSTRAGGILALGASN
jgi:hypothetical protein